MRENEKAEIEITAVVAMAMTTALIEGVLNQVLDNDRNRLYYAQYLVDFLEGVKDVQ